MPPLQAASRIVGAGFIPPSCSSLMQATKDAALLCQPTNGFSELPEGGMNAAPTSSIAHRRGGIDPALVFLANASDKGHSAVMPADQWIQRATGGRHECRPYKQHSAS